MLRGKTHFPLVHRQAWLTEVASAVVSATVAVVIGGVAIGVAATGAVVAAGAVVVGKRMRRSGSRSPSWAGLCSR